MIFKNRNRIKDYWRNLMRSTHNKVSEGAAYISRMIPFARKENWRGTNRSHHSPHDHGKKK